MRKIEKKLSFCLLVVVMAVFFALGVAFAPRTAFAADEGGDTPAVSEPTDDTDTAPDATPDTFCVINGAAVRPISDEKGYYGIRFTAYVPEVVNGVEYRMAIVPSEYVSAYNAARVLDQDIITWLDAYTVSLGGSIASIACEVRPDGYYYAALTDIKYVNLNRNFSAIAYYVKDGANVIGDLATDGARNISAISSTALKDGLFEAEENAEQKAALEDFVTKGANSAKNVLFSAQSDENFWSIASSYNSGATTLDGTVTTEEVGNLGTVYKFSITGGTNQHFETQFNKDEVAERIAGYDVVKLSVYVPIHTSAYSLDSYMSVGVGMGLITKSQKVIPGQWNDIYVSVADFKKSEYFLVASKNTTIPYYIADIKAYTAKQIAEQVTNTVNNLNVEDTNYYKVSEVKSTYDAMSETAKANLSSNVKTKLDSCVKALGDYELGFSSWKLDGSLNYSSWGVVSFTDYIDDEYGYCVETNRLEHMTFGMDLSRIKELKDDGYAKLIFWVYTSVDSGKRRIFLSNSGWNEKDGLTSTVSKVNDQNETKYYIAGDGWTECTIDLSQVSDTHYYIFCPYGKAVSLRITNFYAVK